jgi:hypothetical protein
MASPPPGARDRLSDLPDPLLGSILSFLPNKEAGCTAALSRRWRYIFCNVNTISFEEEEGERASDWDTFYYEAKEMKSCSDVLLDDVCSALLCRRRCAGHHVALRRLRFAFDSCHNWNFRHVDQWLSYVLRHSNQELHLDLRFRIGPICSVDSDDYEDSGLEGEVDSGSDDCNYGWSYALPRRLFRCMVIRTLSVAYCRLNLPVTVCLPFLETLSITAPHDDARSIQRLISSCPSLVDLTLEAIRRLKTVSVLDKRLRRFALRCCHDVTSVDIDASELMSLNYCGTVPAESLLSLHGSPGVASCTFNFCSAHSQEAEFESFRTFMEKISDAKHLHLHYQNLESRFFLRFPSFSSLTGLALQGAIKSCSTVVAVGRVLEQTPNLEVLSLYMEEYKEKEDVEEDDHRHATWQEDEDDARYATDEEDENNAMDDKGDAPSHDLPLAPEEFTVPDESSFSMPCLRHRVKEINMVNYEGREAERMMARLLFCNALVLERMCVVLVRGTFALQSKLKNEIDSWVVADPERIFL